MTLATMADRSLPLAERVLAMFLDWDMDDAHEAARAALLADIAAADRLARGVDESHRAFSAYQDAGWDTDADTAAYNDTMDKLGAHAEAADDEATAAHLAYRDRMQGVARGE